jgi:class 3 adenylate cyclase
MAIQREITALGEREPSRRVAVRVGLNAGEPVADAGDLFGATVNAAARICGHARAGQILVSEVVWRLAEGLGLRLAEHGRVRLRGFSRRFRLFELLW